MPTLAQQHPDAAPQAHRAAEQHRADYAGDVPGMLANMPTAARSPAEVRSALQQLTAALAETGEAGRPGEMLGVLSYRRALTAHALTLEHLLSLEPDPLLCAVYVITYGAALRDKLSAHLPDAPAQLAALDAPGLPEAEAVRNLLESFQSLEALSEFLAAHHLLSLGVEALAEPDFAPHSALGSALEALRTEVQAVTISGRVEA